MPFHCLPLRQRCRVQLRVDTSLHANDERLERSRKSRKPARSKCLGIQEYWDDLYFTSVSSEQRCKVPTSTLHSIHQVLPSVYIALYDGDGTTSSYRTPLVRSKFTHIIKITHASPQMRAGLGWSHYDDKEELNVLHLSIPYAQPSINTRGRRARTLRERDCTFLTDKQLLMTRDFLSLALPYYSLAHPPSKLGSDSQDMVEVLVTAPVGNDCAADIISIIACYLTYVSGEDPETVLEQINDDIDCVPGEWRGVIDADSIAGLAIIGRVALLEMATLIP